MCSADRMSRLTKYFAAFGIDSSRIAFIGKHPMAVYNLEVYKQHVFRVGSEGIVVHNCTSSNPELEEDPIDIFNDGKHIFIEPGPGRSGGGMNIHSYNGAGSNTSGDISIFPEFDEKENMFTGRFHRLLNYDDAPKPHYNIFENAELIDNSPKRVRYSLKLKVNDSNISSTTLTSGVNESTEIRSFFPVTHIGGLLQATLGEA